MVLTLADVRALVDASNPYTQDDFAWRRIERQIGAQQIEAYKSRWRELVHLLRAAIKPQVSSRAVDHSIFRIDEQPSSIGLLNDRIVMDQSVVPIYEALRAFLCEYNLVPT